MINQRRVSFLLILILMSCCGLLMAQQTDSARKEELEKEARMNFFQQLNAISKQQALKSVEKYQSGKVAIRQRILIEELRNTCNRAKIFLKNRIDSSAIAHEFAQLDSFLNIVADGIFVHKGTRQTQRNLAVSSAILGELVRKVTERKNKLSLYLSELIKFRDNLDSLASDSALYIFPSDSLASIKYITRLQVVSMEIEPVDSMIDRNLSIVQELQTRVEQKLFLMKAQLEDIERYRQDLTSHTFDREFTNLADKFTFKRPFKEIVRFSIAKEKLAWQFYIRNNTGRLIVLILLVIMATYFIYALKARISKKQQVIFPDTGQLVVRYPVLSSLMIIISLFQFIFPEPPFIFNLFLWLISAISLTIIFKKFITAYWMRFWMVMLMLFILASLDNFILQASRIERWIMVLLSLAGIVTGLLVLLRGNRVELKEKAIVYFIVFHVVFEFASLMYNYFGRYNLAKMLFISGFAGFIIALLFLWTVRLLNEGLKLTYTHFKNPDKKLLYINFDKLGNEVPSFFYYLLVSGWVILVGRNFYAFKLLATPFLDFLNQERIIGDYSFTINGVFIFLLIMACSVILSKLISFFATGNEHNIHTTGQPKRSGIGSWLLLIRISIISLGLFLAFAAAGIPLDRLTIILGALGVGIGLGLQGLVNNLVSGLIIAFEKPVNVGDIIEVNGKPGTMKAIGFRSSIVTLADGACLVIPNGDLLSQHLINWTMGNSHRRINILLGVAYGTDLEKTKKVLTELIGRDDRVLKFPVPLVVARNFNDSSIELELLFWIGNIRDFAVVKSDMITNIDKVFKEEGIVIPFPQQEIHIVQKP